jgi:hypothetical protein
VLAPFPAAGPGGCCGVDHSGVGRRGDGCGAGRRIVQSRAGQPVRSLRTSSGSATRSRPKESTPVAATPAEPSATSRSTSPRARLTARSRRPTHNPRKPTSCRKLAHHRPGGRSAQRLVLDGLRLVKARQIIGVRIGRARRMRDVAIRIRRPDRPDVGVKKGSRTVPCGPSLDVFSGAPPGIRTPNPRIKSATSQHPPMPDGPDRCRLLLLRSR